MTLQIPQNTPDIIREAAKSPLGILALMVLALAVLAYVFFHDAPVSVRVWIFAAMFAGVAGFAVAVVRVPKDRGFGWNFEKTDDCTEKDRLLGIGGVSQPAPEQCNASTVGTVAVCWDGKVYQNPPLAPICAYKNVGLTQCTGGHRPGRMFVCKENQ